MRRAGFTVLEMIISVAVFAVAMVALIGVFPVSIKAGRQAQSTLVAVNLAERELEVSRSAAYDAIAGRVYSYDLDIMSNGVTIQITYDTEVEVNEVRDGLKHLKSTVTWAEPDAQVRTTSLETYVARRIP